MMTLNITKYSPIEALYHVEVILITYSEFNKKHFGGSCIKDMFTKFQERVEELTKVDGYLYEYQELSEEINQSFILIIINPLMKRVHGTVRYAYITLVL